MSWLEDAIEQGKSTLSDEEFNQIFDLYGQGQTEDVARGNQQGAETTERPESAETDVSQNGERGNGETDAGTAEQPQQPAVSTEQTPAAEQTEGELQPIGRGVFGNIYDQFRGRAKEAINFLLKRKEGDAVGALHHKDVGDIDIWYGNDRAGLKKIAEKHPEVLNDLQGVIDRMHVVTSSDNRIVLESDTHRAIVSKMLGNKKTDNWLLTAYEKKGTSASSSDIETEPEGKRNGTAAPQSSLSSGKDTKISENGEKKSDVSAESSENEREKK